MPFWSDRFGLGVPLAAESHAAAFYPPNLLLYRLLDVATAYRLAMGSTTRRSSRRPTPTPACWGSGGGAPAPAGLTFALCGFQAIHSGHEPFYGLMPYLPLVLLYADRFAADRPAGLAGGVAGLWGLQLTLGHFQIQL